jgi:molecular chaperone GrpE
VTDTPHAGQDQAPETGPLQDDVGVEGAQDTAPPSDPPQEPVAGPPYETPEETAQRVKELTADLQRLQAEYVNYKRRVDRDRELVLQNAKYSILSALLPVLDDIDRAREHEELDGGFKAIAESLERIVSGEGLVKFGASGDPFDPRHHEALMHSLSPHVTTTTCDKVVQAGYQLGDRVVRPALVTVVDPDPDTAGRTDGQDEEQAAPEVATADEQG